MENLLSTGAGFTIVVDHKDGDTTGSPTQAHGLFDTAEEAEAYITGGAQLLIDGVYVKIARVSWGILPLTVQG